MYCRVKDSMHFCKGITFPSDADGEPTTHRKFVDLKKEITMHLHGLSPSGRAHLEAFTTNKAQNEADEKSLESAISQVSAGLTAIKMKSAGIHYETCISLVASLGANVGTINHSRYANLIHIFSSY